MLLVEPSANTMPAPYCVPPLLSTIATLPETEQSLFIKRFKKLTPIEWMTNNRWFYRQSLTTQFRVLVSLTRLSLPLINLDSHTLANVVFEYMAHPESLTTSLELTETEQTMEYVLELPASIYGLLIERLSDPNTNSETMKRVVQTILKNIVRLMTGDRPYFSRTHIITLYEKLRTVFITSTQATGSAKFANLVEIVVGLCKYRATSVTNHATQYRMKCLQTMHHTLLATTFRSLACRLHYEDIDVLFHYCRKSLRGSLIHWLSQLDTAEVDFVWTRCPHISAYCQTNAFKLRAHFHSDSPILNKCTAALSTDEELLVKGLGSAVDLLHKLNGEGTTKGLWSRLQAYPVQIRRKLFERIMTELEADTRETPSPAVTCARAMFTTQARLIIRLMNIKNAHFEHTIHFYTQHLGWSTEKVFATQKWSDMTRARLQQWTETFHMVPLTIMADFINDMVARVRRLMGNAHTFTFQTHHYLQMCEEKLSCILSKPLGNLRDVAIVQQILRVMGELVTDHLHSLQVHRYPRVRHFLRCMLLLEHMLLRPERNAGPSGSHGECAICYNEESGSLHTLACGHAFHPECMIQSAQFAGIHTQATPFLAKCPYCMTEVQPHASTLNALHTHHATPQWRLALHYYVYAI